MKSLICFHAALLSLIFLSTPALAGELNTPEPTFQNLNQSRQEITPLASDSICPISVHDPSDRMTSLTSGPKKKKPSWLYLSKIVIVALSAFGSLRRGTLPWSRS